MANSHIFITLLVVVAIYLISVVHTKMDRSFQCHENLMPKQLIAKQVLDMTKYAGTKYVVLQCIVTQTCGHNSHI